MKRDPRIDPEKKNSDITNTQEVEGVYNRYAKWYDPTRKFWNPFFAALAEKKFEQLLAENIKDGAKILDVGVGTGLNIERIQRHKIDFSLYEGIDLTEKMLAEARRKFGHLKNLTLEVGDITRLNITKKYDAIISTLVLSHVKEQNVIVQKLLDALKPGGVFLLLFISPKPDLRLVDTLALFIYQTILHFTPVPIEIMRKFPPAKIRQHFPCLGGQMSVYLYLKE